MKKKTGFTLAEVLITIGILGVIAALVMPIINTNVNHHIWMNGLKTAISNLSNGFEQMRAANIVDRMEGTTLWESIIKDTVESENVEVKEELSKYFSITSMGTGTPDDVTVLNRDNTQFNTTPSITGSLRLTLANNTILYMHLYKVGDKRQTATVCNTIKTLGGSMCSYVADIYVDVNGIRRPNRIGDDIYYFLLGSDGKLYPYGSKDIALYNSRNSDSAGYWKVSCDGSPLQNTCTDPRMLTARVIDEGFTIKY